MFPSLLNYLKNNFIQVYPTKLSILDQHRCKITQHMKHDKNDKNDKKNSKYKYLYGQYIEDKEVVCNSCHNNPVKKTPHCYDVYGSGDCQTIKSMLVCDRIDGDGNLTHEIHHVCPPFEDIYKYDPNTLKFVNVMDDNSIKITIGDVLKWVNSY